MSKPDNNNLAGTFNAPGRLMPDGSFYPSKEYVGLIFDPRIQGIDAAKISDDWKLSGAVDFIFKDCSALHGGLVKEDGLDVNNESCGNSFEGGIIEAGHGVAVTCKGGSSFNEWRNVVIRGRGKHCEFEFGNHSDQSWEKCEGNRLVNVTHEDGKPVRVAYGRSTRPLIMGGNCVIVKPWSFVLWAYTWAKHIFPFIP